MTLPAPPAPAPPELELFCPGCGYSLRGITSDNCPECGIAIDRSAAAVSRIPWEHRRRIGYVRAYWRTLFTSTARIADDMMRPVLYRDARLFQLITVGIAGLPAIVLAAWPLPPRVYGSVGFSFTTWPVALPPGYAVDIGLPLLAGVGVRVVAPLAILLYLLAMTGVASYFFHPPHLTVVQQNRAIALSYYACAHLVLLAVPGLAAIAFILLETHEPDWWRRDEFIWRPLTLLVAGLMPVMTLLLMWVGYLRMLRRATLCSTARAATMGAVLPLAWAALFAVIALGIPWVAGYAMLVVWSFA